MSVIAPALRGTVRTAGAGRRTAHLIVGADALVISSAAGGRVIGYPDVIEAVLTRRLGRSQLSLTRVDGTTAAFSWRRGRNRHDAVLDALAAVLGARLRYR